MIHNREPRKKITTIAIRPSVHEKLRKIAHMTGFPVNAVINDYLEQYVIDHQKIVDSYDKKYGNED